jgi:hypothetical protein
MHTHTGKHTIFHYNPDLSGEVLIDVRGGHVEVGPGERLRVTVTGEDLLDFVLARVQTQLISKLEDLDLRKLLGFWCVLLLAVGITACSGGIHPTFDGGFPAPDSSPLDDAAHVDFGMKMPLDLGPDTDPPDAPPTADAGTDARVGDDGGAGVVVALMFPSIPPDTYAASGSDPLGNPQWIHGDDWAGSRATLLDVATHADVALVPTHNYVCGAGYVIHVSLNSYAVGDLVLHAGDTSVHASFDFAAVPGPAYDLRYDVDAASCGAVEVADHDARNTVTLR